MRGARILLPIALACAVAACARQQPTSYVFDTATGHYVPVVRQDGRPASGPTYAQQTSARQTAALNGQRGLFSSPQTAQQSYAQQTEPHPQSARNDANAQYLQPQPSSGGERGLFNWQRAPAHAAKPAVPQSYVYQYHPPATAAAARHRPPPAATAAYAAQPPSNSYVPANRDMPYTLGPGDKLRVIVFGQNGISGSYLVDASGNVSLPLVGTVPAHGETTAQLARSIAERLKQGYVRAPHVTVSVESYRPFFILGEVTNPGQYPYVPNMTAETAVAIAGGFTPRAKKKEVELSRNTRGQHFTGDVPLNYPLRPGDTVEVKERWF